MVRSVNPDVIEIKQFLKSIMIDISNISNKIKDDDEEGDLSLDWKFAAMVLDKLCLYVFAILTVVLTCGILMSSPNFFKLK